MKTIIMQVWKDKKGQKFVGIPKESDIVEGDYVSITRIDLSKDEKINE